MPFSTKRAQYRFKIPFRKNELIRDKFLHRGFCASGTRIWGRILGNKFLTPEFWTRIHGSFFFFPEKEAPRDIHPWEIHLPKFTFQNSTQKSGQKIHIARCRAISWFGWGTHWILRQNLVSYAKNLSWSALSHARCGHHIAFMHGCYTLGWRGRLSGLTINQQDNTSGEPEAADPDELDFDIPVGNTGDPW